MSTHTHPTVDAQLAAFAEEVGTEGPVAVEGGRTRWDLGGPLAEARIVHAPEGIVDYIPEEMIVTVRAGTSVSDLHAALAEKSQWTALPERGGTVGGALAVGQSDYRRMARGDLRSAPLQIRYVSAEGELVKSGGPTVKNVSGFDLPRLLTGSLGTLGCLGEVTLRTNPIPPVITWLRSTDADPFAVFAELLAPGAVLWDGTTVTVMLTGHGVDVSHDIDVLSSLGTFAECEAPPAPQGHRWSLKPGDLRGLAAGSTSSHDTGAFLAEVGVGVVHCEKPQARPALPAAIAAVHDRMKAEFDPTGRLNPGRRAGTR